MGLFSVTFLGCEGLLHFSHFLVTQSVDGVLSCLFLFSLGQLYRMVYHHLAVCQGLADLNFILFPIVDCPSEDFIIGKAVANLLFCTWLMMYVTQSSTDLEGFAKRIANRASLSALFSR